jgi:hypothetical protein
MARQLGLSDEAAKTFTPLGFLVERNRASLQQAPDCDLGEGAERDECLRQLSRCPQLEALQMSYWGYGVAYMQAIQPIWALVNACKQLRSFAYDGRRVSGFTPYLFLETPLAGEP